MKPNRLFALPFFVLLLAAHAVAQDGTPPVAVPAAPVFADDTAEVEQMLASGFWRLEDRDYRITRTVVVRHSTTIIGRGAKSRIVWAGEDPAQPAVQIGLTEQNIYGVAIRDLHVFGGTVLFQRIGQDVRVSGLTVHGAIGDGIVIDAIGDRMVLRDVDVRFSGGAGMRIVGRRANNGIRLESYSASGNGGPGLIAETAENFHGYLADLSVVHATIQGNCQRDPSGAEVVLGGAVVYTEFDHCHIEQTVSRAGLRLESRWFDDNPAPRVPRTVLIGGGSRFEGKLPAMRSIEVLAMQQYIQIEDSFLRQPIKIVPGVIEPVQVRPRGPAHPIDRAGP